MKKPSKSAIALCNAVNPPKPPYPYWLELVPTPDVGKHQVGLFTLVHCLEDYVLAEVPDSEDRWQWLWRGIQLVRDEGLKYNPNDPKIYKHIARLFWHKIGNYVDPHNIYY